MTCAFSLTSSRPVDADAVARQLVDLHEQRLRIDDHAVADDARDAGMQDAGRNQVKDELLALHIHRVPGVVTTLIPRDRREVRRQHVDDLALAFVAPLRARELRYSCLSTSSKYVSEPRKYPHRRPRWIDDFSRRQLAHARRSLSRSRMSDAPGLFNRRGARSACARRAPSSTTFARGDQPVYGINTGFGNFAEVRIPSDSLAELQVNLLRSHAAGVGDPLPVPVVRATMALRANVLAKGFSGISRRDAGAASSTC